MKLIILPSVFLVSSFISLGTRAQEITQSIDTIGFTGITETVVIGEKRLPGTTPGFASRNIEIITAQSIQQLPVKTLS